MALNKTRTISLDVLQLEKINLYRKYIERMSAREIMQAYAESGDQPVWREALEIYGPRCIHRLMQLGDSSDMEVSERLDKQIQTSSILLLPSRPLE